LKYEKFDKRISAYADGALRGPKRAELEHELERDPKLAVQLDRSRALGRLVREAWSEGPPAPSPDFLLASIRPALAQIDRERRAQPSWQRTLEIAFARIGAALRPSPALATAAVAAFVLALAILPQPELKGLEGSLSAHSESASLTRELVHMPPAPDAFSLSVPADFSAELDNVYDVSPGRPAVLFQSGDGSTTLWLIEDGDQSFHFGSGQDWG
jgi:anti-sigma-K factor RskA